MSREGDSDMVIRPNKSTLFRNMGVQTDMSVPRGNTIIVLPLAHPDATELQRANLALRSVNAHLLPVSFGNFEDEDPLAQASEVPVEENPTAPTISSSTPEHVGTSSLPAKEWPTIHESNLVINGDGGQRLKISPKGSVYQEVDGKLVRTGVAEWKAIPSFEITPLRKRKESGRVTPSPQKKRPRERVPQTPPKAKKSVRRLFADDAPVTDENLRSPRAKRVAPGSPVKSVTPKKAPPKRRPNRFAVLGGVIFEEDKADQQRQSDVVSPITSDSDDDGYKDRNRPGVYPKKGKGRKLRRLPVKTRRPYVTVADYIAAKDANKEVGPSRQVDPAEEEQVVSQVGFGHEDEEEWDDSPGIQQSLNAAFEAAEAKEANQRATVMAPGSEETTAGTNANQAAVTLVSREKLDIENNRRLLSHIKHVRSELLEGHPEERPGEFARHFTAFKETYTIGVGDTSEAVKNALAHALRQHGSDNDFVRCFISGSELTSDIVLLPCYTKVNKVDMNAVIASIEAVDQSKRHLLLNELSFKIYRFAGQQGSGVTSDFVEDEAECDSNATTEPEDQDDDVSDLIDDDSLSEAETIPVPDENRDPQVPDAITRNVSGNSILAQILNLPSTSRAIRKSPPKQRKRRSIAPGTRESHKASRPKKVFVESIRKGGGHGFKVLTAPNGVYRKPNAQFQIRTKQADVRQISKLFIRLDTTRNCFPKAIVVVLLRHLKDKSKSKKKIHLPTQVLGDSLSETNSKDLSLLLDAIRKHPDSARGKRSSVFQKMVETLMTNAGLREAYGRGDATDEDFRLMMNFLNSHNIRLVIYNEHGTIMFDGDHRYRKNQILVPLMLRDKHFWPVTKTNDKSFCRNCCVVFEKDHVCPYLCKYCNTPNCEPELSDPEPEELLECPDCPQLLRDEACLTNHREMCSYLCPRCGRKTHNNKKGQTANELSNCRDWKCFTCGEKVTMGHQCYLTGLQAPRRKKTQYAFYDLETALVKTTIGGQSVLMHKPVMACVTFRCCSCTDETCPYDVPEEQIKIMYDNIDLNKDWFDAPPTACRRELTFTGEDCVKQLLDELKKWSRRSRGCRNIVMAHCGGRFDHHFMFRAMADQGLKPTVLQNGNHFISLHLRKYNIKFIDSFRFISIPLARFQKTLGLSGSYKKYYWPHKITTVQLEDLPHLPSKDDYDYQKMNVKEKQEFDEWYSQQNQDEVFQTKKLMEEYCRQDVRVLAEGVMSFRKLWLEESDLDPFYTKVTLPGAVMELFRTCYLEGTNRLPITPAYGYDSYLKSSVIGTQWLNEIERQENITIAREVKVGMDFAFDGALFEGEIPEKQSDPDFGEQIEVRANDKRVVKLYDFFGCYHHACYRCYPAYTRPVVRPDLSKDKFHDTHWINQSAELRSIGLRTDGFKLDKSANRMSAQALRNHIRRRKKFAKSIGVEYVTIWECDYKRMVNNRTQAEKEQFELEKKAIKREKQIGCLKHRKGMHGGRTEVFGLHHKCKPNETIRYLDVSGLYPHVLMQGAYAIDHPIKLSSDEIEILRSGDRDRQLELLNSYDREISQENDGFEGTYDLFLRLRVIPPQSLRIPVLPSKINDKLIFANCRSCAEQKGEECKHSHEERAIEVYTHLYELKRALEMGYRIHEYIIGEKYPIKRGVFREFIKNCMLRKKKAELEGNPGLRYIEKLKANSFWGVLAKNSDHKLSRMCSTKECYSLLSDPEVSVSGIIPFGDVGKVEYKLKKMFRKTGKDTSLINGTLVTAYARSVLYRFLSLVNPDDLQYSDTDSIVYVHRKGEADPLKPFMNGEFNPPPPTDMSDPYYEDDRNLAGGLEDEILKDFGPGHEIREWVSTAPKSYAFKVFRVDQPYDSDEPVKIVSKCKGIRMQGEAFDKFNFEFLKGLIRGDSENSEGTLPQINHFRLDSHSHVISKDEVKKLTFDYNKRIAVRHEPQDGDNLGNITTLPFGFNPIDDADNPPVCCKHNIPPHWRTKQDQIVVRELVSQLVHQVAATVPDPEEVPELPKEPVRDDSNMLRMLRGFREERRESLVRMIIGGSAMIEQEEGDDGEYYITRIEPDEGPALICEVNPLLSTNFEESDRTISPPSPVVEVIPDPDPVVEFDDFESESDDHSDEILCEECYHHVVDVCSGKISEDSDENDRQETPSSVRHTTIEVIPDLDSVVEFVDLDSESGDRSNEIICEECDAQPQERSKTPDLLDLCTGYEPLDGPPQSYITLNKEFDPVRGLPSKDFHQRQTRINNVLLRGYNFWQRTRIHCTLREKVSIETREADDGEKVAVRVTLNLNDGPEILLPYRNPLISKDFTATERQNRNSFLKMRGFCRIQEEELRNLPHVTYTLEVADDGVEVCTAAVYNEQTYKPHVDPLKSELFIGNEHYYETYLV